MINLSSRAADRGHVERGDRHQQAGGTRGRFNVSSDHQRARQIVGAPPTMFIIYTEDDFIEVTSDTRFFQHGEAKCGRPILVRDMTEICVSRRSVKKHIFGLGLRPAGGAREGTYL